MVAHGSVKCCETTPIGQVDEPKDSCTGVRRTKTCVASKNVDASRDSVRFSPNEQHGGGGGGAAILPLFLFLCLADHKQDWPSCKVHFYGMATNTMIVRNINNQKAKFFKATRRAEYVKLKCRGTWRWWPGLVKPACKPASCHPKPCALLKNVAGIFPVRCSLLALVRRKKTVVREQFSPQEPLSLRFSFARTRVQHSPGSSTIELFFRPRQFWGVFTQQYMLPTRLSATVPPASRVTSPPEEQQIEARKSRTW